MVYFVGENIIIVTRLISPHPANLTMSAKKKKKTQKHKCKNHPGRVACGRCKKCGKWICRECARLEKGNFYCKEECQKKTDISDTITKEAEKQTAVHKEPVPDKLLGPYTKQVSDISQTNKILLLAGITFGICGIAFGLIGIRTNRELERQVETLTRQQEEFATVISKNRIQINTLKKVLKKQIHEERTIKMNEQDTGLPNKKETPRKITPSSYEYPSDKLPYTFDNGSTSKKLISLTFDGDSYCNIAGAILDTLRSRNVKATMFLTGKFIRSFPALLKQLLSEGHEIGNHTNTHPRLTTWKEDRTNKTRPEITESVIARELRRTNDSFNKVTGKDMSPLWRAPYGEKNRQINTWAKKQGYLHIGWKQAHTWKYNHDTNDWVPNPETPGYHTSQEVLDKFNTLAVQKPYGMNGAIILMHLGSRRNPPEDRVHLVLGKIIDQLREKGYEFVPVSVMLQEAGVDLNLLKRGT